MAVDEKYDLYVSVDQEMTDLETVDDLVSMVADRILTMGSEGGTS